jgi:hypothetical protein
VKTPDWSKPTAQFLGRFQPWHKGHRAVFEQILGLSVPGYKAKTHDAQQVCIMVRGQETNWEDGHIQTTESAPYTFSEIRDMICEDLLPEYEGRFMVIAVPNITNVFYGRTVGFEVDRVSVEADLESLDSKTIRAEAAAVEAHFFNNRG